MGTPSLIIRIAVTSTAVLLACVVAAYHYRTYLLHPWTRDGRVQALVVQVAPRINGPLVELPIEDNQEIKAGDLLFKIDPRTFQTAVTQAEARLAQARADFADAKDKAQRARHIHATDPGAESRQLLVQLEDAERGAAAVLKGAEADLETAKLDLEFTEVHAPVDGYITHLTVDVGTQAVANEPILALVNKNSFWVSAFFRETLMENVKPGYKAVVRLMAYPDSPIEAEVESIGWGIALDDGQPGYNLLPRVRPTFEWIRLAQRIPVRIRLKDIPEGIELRVGITASVIVLGPE